MHDAAYEESKQERLRVSVTLMHKMYQRVPGNSIKRMATTMHVDWRAVNDILAGKRYPQPEMAYAFVAACYTLADHATDKADVIQESSILLHALGYTTPVETHEALDAIRAMRLPTSPTI